MNRLLTVVILVGGVAIVMHEVDGDLLRAYEDVGLGVCALLIREGSLSIDLALLSLLLELVSHGRHMYHSSDCSLFLKVVLAISRSLSSLMSSCSCLEVLVVFFIVTCTFLISWAEYFGVHKAVLYAVLISFSGVCPCAISYW